MKLTETRPVADELAQFALAQLLARGDPLGAVEVATKHGWSRPERVLREAVNFGTTMDGSWAAALSDYRALSTGFLDWIRAQSPLDSIAPFALNVPPKRRVAISTTAVTGSVVTGGTVKPVTRLGIGLAFTEPTVALALVVLSDEVLRLAHRAALDLIRRELAAGVATAANGAFLAALESAAPPGATFAGTDDYLRDLAAAAGAVSTRGTGRLFAIVSPTVAVALALDERSAFDNMTPNGGTVRGVQHVVSDALESGDVLVVDASGLAIDAGQLTLATSNATALQMDDAPEDDATEFVSMFQTNSVALRAERVVSFEALRQSAVARITSPTYGVAGDSP